MPSLPSMVYLEKEIKQMNGELDEFNYSGEYIDSLFDKSDGHSESLEQESNMKIDCLLG